MKGTEIDVPEAIRPYLNEIAERVWADRATVMVGAGFSKNAAPAFPDWNQLGDLFYQKAHGVKPDSANLKYLNALRLAEEVQAAIGRPALENLLRSSIPDLSIEPSSLHVDLLELPWVDVFTTNYDTLLERASAKVITRRYEPVVNKEDIPYAIKPRIVKLHGSFPSERPFIITEEDYRRYPHDYAPFVNTVQQALLENTFCLIGFSGDDPNFLQWIGWIRDNLGKDKTQKIFLVGIFNLSSARLQLLSQRGIIVVDLSSCQWIEKHDHKKALSQFFEYIRSKKPDALDWPPYNSRIRSPKAKDDRNAEIEKITDEWRRQRQVYPGWLVLPHDNRQNLWAYTSSWVNYLPDAQQSPPGLELQYAFELIWRLNRCLLPIFDNISEFCEHLLAKYWPFQNVNAPENSQIIYENNEYQDLPWNELKQSWLAIALAMLRFYREEGHLGKWKETEIRLRRLSDEFSAEQRDFLNYESFLFSIFNLDISTAKQRLENWRPNESQPYWMAKRAAALGEIGLLSEAETISKDALENIRKKLNQKIGTTDLTLVSLESYAMLLGKYIQDAAAIEKGEWTTYKEQRTQFKDRWNELKGFKCDPWNEIKLFDLTLKNPVDHIKDVIKKREFDIGRVTQTRNFGSNDEEVLNAYAYLRFCEEVGLPYQISNYTIVGKTALASLKLISRYSSFWAIATLVRLGDENAVDSLFSRESVYKFTADEADQLIHGYLDALANCKDVIHADDAFRNDSYGSRLAKLLPEIISRLCCKCSSETKHRILEFITSIYASPEKDNYRKINNLTKRLISSMSEMEQYQRVPDFLKIPYPEGLNHAVNNEFLNPFLLLEVNKKPESAPVLEVQHELVEHLLQQATLDDKVRRQWAITSLVTLYNLSLLDDIQSKNLAGAIWHDTDHYGLPDHTDFYKFVFLSLPSPEDVDPSTLFKNYVNSTSFPIQKSTQKRGVSITRGNIPVVYEIISAHKNNESIWTAEDAAEILQRLLEWWDADKDRLIEKKKSPAVFSSIPDEFRARYANMIDLFAEVVGPKLNADLPDEIKASLSRLLKEVRDYGLPSLAAEVACLHIYPEHTEEVYNRINEALISNQDNFQRDGLKAISKIILNSNDANASTVGQDPVYMLGQYLTWCTTYSIISALLIIVNILKCSPAFFSHSLEVATQRRLDRLLTETNYDSESQYLNFEEKLELRRISSIVGAALWEYYKIHSLPIPEIIKKWREVCLSHDEFAEIRTPWLNEE